MTVNEKITELVLGRMSKRIADLESLTGGTINDRTAKTMIKMQQDRMAGITKEGVHPKPVGSIMLRECLQSEVVSCEIKDGSSFLSRKNMLAVITIAAGTCYYDLFENSISMVRGDMKNGKE